MTAWRRYALPLRQFGRFEAMLTQSEVQFSEDVSLHLLDETALVLCEGAQSIYELNTVATFIWCCLEENTSPQRAATDLSSSLNVEPTEALSYVQACVEEWWKAGLIVGSEACRSEPIHQPSPETLPPQSNAADHDGVDLATIFESYRLADSTFRVSFPSAEIHDLVHEGLRNLRDPGPSEHQIRVGAANGSYNVGEPANGLFEGIGRKGLLPTLMRYFARTALVESNYFLAVHAAALQGDRGSYLRR